MRLSVLFVADKLFVGGCIIKEEDWRGVQEWGGRVIFTTGDTRRFGTAGAPDMCPNVGLRAQWD